MNHLLARLLPELAQAERSAAEHPAREAQRLASYPPGRAMHDIAAHADGTCRALSEILRRIAPDARAGAGMGTWFSIMRERVTDLWISREGSYRQTLLGLHHTMDLLDLVVAAADEDDRTDLARWATATRDERAPLLLQCTAELAWFGHHPDIAAAPAKSGTTPRVLHAVTTTAGAILRRAAA
jgi:hypothetical protein